MAYFPGIIPDIHHECFKILNRYTELAFIPGYHGVVTVDDKHRIMSASGAGKLETLLGKDYFQAIFGLDLSNYRDQERASQLPLYKALQERVESEALVLAPLDTEIVNNHQSKTGGISGLACVA